MCIILSDQQVLHMTAGISSIMHVTGEAQSFISFQKMVISYRWTSLRFKWQFLWMIRQICMCQTLTSGCPVREFVNHSKTVNVMES